MDICQILNPFYIMYISPIIDVYCCLYVAVCLFRKSEGHCPLSTYLQYDSVYII